VKAAVAGLEKGDDRRQIVGAADTVGKRVKPFSLQRNSAVSMISDRVERP